MFSVPNQVQGSRRHLALFFLSGRQLVQPRLDLGGIIEFGPGQDRQAFVPSPPRLYEVVLIERDLCQGVQSFCQPGADE